MPMTEQEQNDQAAERRAYEHQIDQANAERDLAYAAAADAERLRYAEQNARSVAERDALAIMQDYNAEQTKANAAIYAVAEARAETEQLRTATKDDVPKDDPKPLDTSADIQ